MLHLHRFQRRLSKSKELSMVRLILAFGLAGIDTVWSLYMDGLGLSESAIGFISSALIVLTFLMSLFATPILEYFKQTKILSISILASAACFVLVGMTRSIPVFLVAAALLTIFGILRSLSFSIIFRDVVRDDALNKEGGFLYTLLNVGWLVGPLIASFFLLRWGIGAVFMSAAAFYLLGLLLFSLSQVRVPKKKVKQLHLNGVRTLKKFVGNRRLWLPYLMVAGIETWWALVYVYVPLFIIKNGLGASTIGIFMASLVVPLVLFENAVGKWSEKLGFRFFFVLGFGGLSLVSIVLFFTPSITLQLIFIAVASIFAACIEPIQDTFFFKRTSKEFEEEYFPLFRTSADVGGFMGKFSVAFVLLFLPNSFAYFVIFLLMCLFTLCALKIPRWER